MHVEIKIEHFKSQLTAGNNVWPFAAHPTRVVLEMGQQNRIGIFIVIARRERHMYRRVIDLDNLAIGLDAVGNINGLLEGADQRLRNGGLAVSSGAVDQNGSTRIGSGT